MRIGLYVDVAKDPEPRGVGLHIVNLIRALAEIDEENEYLLYYQCGLIGPRAPFPHCPASPRFRSRPIRCPAAVPNRHPRLWWNWYLPLIVRRDGVDVFHGPSHFVPGQFVNRSIVTIHDIAYFKMQLYTDGVTRALQSWTRQSLEVASRVIALSQNTRADLEALGIAPRKIRVIYGGGNVITEELIEYSRWRELRQRYSLPDKYVLFVGTIHPRKNVPFLLRSFAKWQRSNGRTHGLVLAGRRDSATSEVETVIRDLGIQDSVVITGYLEEWEIPLLYKMADVFVLPTLYEGFTLVTIEAMNYGVPVIATDTSSIREGVGEAAVLVPLNDVDALSDAIGTVVKDSEKRRRMVDAGKEQAKKFTWETCARQTIEVYKEVHQNGR